MEDDDLYASTKAKSLNEALINAAATLSPPDLPSPSNGRILSCAANHNLRLTCLPKLDKLRHLVVNFRGLFGPLSHMSRANEKDLTTPTPPNLKSLILICDMEGNETSTAGTERDMYESDLCHAMRGLRAMYRKSGDDSMLRYIEIAHDDSARNRRLLRREQNFWRDHRVQMDITIRPERLDALVDQAPVASQEQASLAARLQRQQEMLEKEDMD